MSLRDQVLAAAETYTKRSNPKLRWDEWNYFYTQIAEQPGPAPEQFGFTRISGNEGFLESVDPMTVDFWWSKVSTLIAGAGSGGGSTDSGGGSTGGGGNTNQPTPVQGNVFTDTLLMLVSIIFAGRMLT